MSEDVPQIQCVEIKLFLAYTALVVVVFVWTFIGKNRFWIAAVYNDWYGNDGL